MRADTVFTPLQGGSAGEAVTRSPGRAGVDAEGMEAFAVLMGQAQASEARPRASHIGAAPTQGSPDPDAATATAEAALAPPSAEAVVTEAKSEDGADPQVLPPADNDQDVLPDGPQVLPGEAGVISGKDAGPQILPDEAEGTGKSGGDTDPQILPHNPAIVGKDSQGPQVLPGDASDVSRGKGGALLPQVNPGPGPQETAPADAPDESAPPARPAGQAVAGAPAGSEALVPLAPALTRRLLATQEARDAAPSRNPDLKDAGSALKMRLVSDASPAALQAATGVPTSPSAPAVPAIPAQAGQAAPDPGLPAPLATSRDAAASLSADALSADAMKSGAAAVDRGLGLSTLSRATVETTALIAAQIQNRLTGRSTRFEMALTPEGLGRVDVSLEIDSDGRLAARLAFDNPAAATELRGRADELRRQLEQAGLHLDGDALQFTERDPSSTGRGFSGFDRRAFARASDLNDQTDTTVISPAAWQPLALTRDRVDLKV